MEDNECFTEFRVRKCDLNVLGNVLRIPEEFILDQRSVVGGIEAMCILRVIRTTRGLFGK